MNIDILWQTLYCVNGIHSLLVRRDVSMMEENNLGIIAHAFTFSIFFSEDVHILEGNLWIYCTSLCTKQERSKADASSLSTLIPQKNSWVVAGDWCLFRKMARQPQEKVTTEYGELLDLVMVILTLSNHYVQFNGDSKKWQWKLRNDK